MSTSHFQISAWHYMTLMYHKPYQNETKLSNCQSHQPKECIEIYFQGKPPTVWFTIPVVSEVQVNGKREAEDV